MSYGNNKAYQQFSIRVKKENIMPAAIYFMTGVSGWTIPSGVLIYNTTSNKLQIGTGSTVETITSA